MKALRYLILGLLFLSYGSCQKEEKTIIDENTQGFVKTSSIAGLLSRTSQNPTSLDNVLDNSGLIRIQLPVTVVVNGNTISVATSSDYQLVQDAKDAYTTDDDIVRFNYPITIQFQNYTSRVINDYNQLHSAIESCGDDDHFDEIDCVSLVYPFNVNIYDSNNQIANSVSITSNNSLFNFLANLNNYTYVAISYPMSAINSTGQTVVFNSNAELTTFLEDAINDCDDDSGGGGSGTSLSDLLVNGDWYISYCLYDGKNETNYYLGYNFTFNSNETIIVQKNTSTIDGEWELHDEDTYKRLDLHFEGSDLHDIETNWKVIEYNETIIKLKKENSDLTDYLTFTKN